MRLDKFLFERGLARSRTHARDLIVAGAVSVSGKTVSKPSVDVDEEADVRITAEVCPYVSRGGLKLERALEVFGIGVSGAVALDIGASTGGFTDVLLQNGAAKVFAIDSGHDQLADKLQNDSRVVSFEGFNARYLCRDDIGESVSIAVCDVSFISQTLIHRGAFDCLEDNGVYIGLVKPQFECGKEALSKGGIVKDNRFRISAAERIWDSLNEIGFSVIGFDISPITGGDGNVEYLICAVKSGAVDSIDKEYIRRVVLEKRSDSTAK